MVYYINIFFCKRWYKSWKYFWNSSI